MMTVQRVQELGHLHLTFLWHHKELGAIRAGCYSICIPIGSDCHGYHFVGQYLSATKELDMVMQRESKLL